MNGTSLSGDSCEVGSSYAYGKAVLAVADGRIITAKDGFPDNVLGHGEAFHPAVTFSISPLFIDPAHDTGPRVIPRYLHQPEIIFDPIWALPDRTMLRLGDTGNSPILSAVEV